MTEPEPVDLTHESRLGKLRVDRQIGDDISGHQIWLIPPPAGDPQGPMGLAVFLLKSGIPEPTDAPDQVILMRPAQAIEVGEELICVAKQARQRGEEPSDG